MRWLASLMVLGVAGSGCLSGGFPQYTGMYTLVESRQDPGGHPLPWAPSKIWVTHRLIFKSNTYQSWITVLPLLDRYEAGGTSVPLPGFALSLDELTHRSIMNIENPELDGAFLRYGERVRGAESFCSLRYQWAVFSDAQTGIVPSYTTMQKIYRTTETVSLNGGRTIDVQLRPEQRLNPPLDEAATEEWDRQMATANGAQLRLTLRMAALGPVYGCKSGLPQVSEPEGTITLLYRAKSSDLDLTSNPIIEVLDAFRDGLGRGLEFWQGLL